MRATRRSLMSVREARKLFLEEDLATDDEHALAFVISPFLTNIYGSKARKR